MRHRPFLWSEVIRRGSQVSLSRAFCSMSACVNVARKGEYDLRWLVLDVVIVRLSKAGKSHDHQFDEEQDEDGHEANAFDPRVFGYGTRKALIGQCFIGRRQKLQRVVNFDVADQTVAQVDGLHV
jgi:hypothetical protein